MQPPSVPGTSAPTRYEVHPLDAAVQTQDKYNVYVVDDKGIAHAQMVDILPQSQGKTFIVTSGLQGGEEIVAEGAGMVRDGQDVKKLGK